MPEQIRALIVVLGLTIPTWILLRPELIRNTSESKTRQWRNLWFACTIIAFISGNFWIYAIISSTLIVSQKPRPADALAIYCLLLFVVPAANINIPGFGLINYFFTLNSPRLLAIVVLLPAAIKLSRSSQRTRLGSVTADQLFLGYLLLTGALQLREDNITSTLRGCFYIFIDSFLPYYVASRGLQDISDFKRVLSSYTAAAALIGVLAIFETVKYWHLYNPMVNSLGLHWGYGGYLGRESLLRATASVGQPIVLGYATAIGLGLLPFVHQWKKLSARNVMPALLIFGGMVASISRGPWVGALIIALVFIFTGRHGFRNVIKAGFLGVIGLSLLAVFGWGQKIISFLPFIGTVGEENTTYRQDLMTNALIVIKRNLWFGSIDHSKTPEMLRMIQGEGIIDVVNTYLGVALDYGLVGFVLFSGFFVIIIIQLFKTYPRISHDDELRILGRCLLATLVGVAAIISSVASITVVGNLYWLVSGFSVAWLIMINKNVRKKRTAAQVKEQYGSAIHQTPSTHYPTR